MKIRVVFYGGLKQTVGAREDMLDVPQEALAVGELGHLLTARYPALGPRLHTVAYVVNETIVDSDHLLHDGDEAALLPPVSGG